MIKNRIVSNAGWIIGCKLVKAVLSAIVTAITARYLGVANYGLINYAAGIVAFAAPIMRLGLESTIVHELVKRPNEEGKVIGTTISLSLASAFLCIIGIISFVAVVNAGEKDTLIVCSAYSLILIFQALEMIYYWFQAKLLSKHTAMAMLFSYVIISVIQILLVIYNRNVYFFALSYSIDFLIIAVFLFIIYRRENGQKLQFSLSLAKELLHSSKYYIVSNLMVILFTQTDKIMLKLMCGNETTGIYSAASVCAGMTSFVFAAIMDSARSTIFTAKKEDDKLFETALKRLYSVIIYFSLIQSAFITLFAPLVIKIMYGSTFNAAIPTLRVAVWFTTFSYVGTVRNIWILSNQKQKYLWIINLSGAVFNIALNLLLIPSMGAIGAAIASITTQFFTNVIIGYIIKPLRENNRIMFSSLNPQNILGMLRKAK